MLAFMQKNRTTGCLLATHRCIFKAFSSIIKSFWANQHGNCQIQLYSSNCLKPLNNYYHFLSKLFTCGIIFLSAGNTLAYQKNIYYWYYNAVYNSSIPLSTCQRLFCRLYDNRKNQRLHSCSRIQNRLHLPPFPLVSLVTCFIIICHTKKNASV